MNGATSSMFYPPGPAQKLPLFLFLNFLRNPIEVLIDISKYGDISHFRFGGQHIYFLNHPDYIKDVLVTYNSNFIKSRGLQVAKKVLGDGLLTSEGNLHQSQRQVIQPAFNQNQLRVYADIMIEYTLRKCNSWKDDNTLDVHKEFTQLTLAILCKALFGFDIEPEVEEIGKHVTTLVEYFNRARLPLAEIISKLPLPSNRRFRRAKEQLEAIIYCIIYDHKGTSIVNGTSSHAPGNQQADLVSLLLASNNIISIGSNHNLSNSYLRDNIVTIFLAGHETVANALTWTFYLLSQNNREEHKLHEEVDSVIGQGVSLTAADIPRLGYAKKVLAESLRLYPPAWALGRQAIQECKIGGYTIPTGSTVLISQYITHRDSRFFPEPKRFNPDRWTNKTNTDLPRFSYFPFGGGPRSCIGEPFAWMEAILLLSTICHQWKMYHDPNHKVELKPLVTLRPKYGMSMKLERRK